MPSISKIYIINDKHVHTSVHKAYLYKRTLKIGNLTIPSLLYCDICGIYMCSKETYEREYKNKVNSKLFKVLRSNDYIHDTNYKEKKLGNINLNRLSSFEREHFNHAVEKRSIEYKDNIYTLEYCVECDSYGVNDKKYDYIKNNIVINEPIKTIKINKYFNYDLRRSFYTYHQDHNIKDVILLIDGQNYRTQYCSDCDMYSMDEKKFNKNFGSNYNGTVLRDLNAKSFLNYSSTIEFLIKISNFRCKTRNHNIEDIVSVVSVFNKIKQEIEEIEIPAFYCKNCKLYFIYDSEYKELLKHGIPTCPVHEEIKYFSSTNTFDKYESESLLRQFGYNVNSQDNLSTNERRKVIDTVINNGIMNKSDVLSLLNFLASSRKNQYNMQNAVSKWESDIKYTRELNIDDVRRVKVGAFRKKTTKSILENNKIN